MNYAPYEKYKDSGVPWLGQVPEGWKISKVAYEYDVQLGKMLQPEPKSDQDELLPYLRAANLAWSGVDLTDVKEMWINPKEHSKYSLKKNDILISEGGDVGRTSYWDKDDTIYIQNAINRLRVFTEEKTCPKYGYYWFCYLKEKGLIDIVCNSSTIAHYTAEKVKATRILVPLHSQQKAIADFLDAKTAQIDALIAKKEALLKLLAEQRTAIITHAVTKGLNPSAKMKDSGIDWLGKIPAHWEVKPMRYVANPIIGLTYSPNDVVGEAEGTLVLRSSNIQNGKITLDDNVYVSTDIPEKLKTRVGDILVCSRNGSKALIGKNARIDETSAGQTFGAFTTILRSKYGDFLYWVLNSSLFAYQSGKFLTTTINQLTTSTLNAFELPFPPPEEHGQIVGYLESKTGETDQVVTKTEEAICCLKEYRTALITNAVTGKIKVA